MWMMVNKLKGNEVLLFSSEGTPMKAGNVVDSMMSCGRGVHQRHQNDMKRNWIQEENDDHTKR